MYKLYKPFNHWNEKGALWFYSDPHFGDEEMKYLRKNYIGDEEQVKRINSKVGKNDTLVILGDVGNIEFVCKLKGYKILVCGNHDAGAHNYQLRYFNEKFDKRKYTFEEVKEYASKLKYYPCNQRIDEGYDTMHSPFEYWSLTANNGLFNEVYEGPVIISEKIILSHEPIHLPYMVNIHGHDHSQIYSYYIGSVNCCAELIDYTPVNFNDIVRSGILKDVDDIHRFTIDNAIERKLTKSEKRRIEIQQDC